MINKHISKGIGSLTPEVWRRLVDNLEWGESMARKFGSDYQWNKSRFFGIEAKITSNEKVTGKAQWRYGLAQVRLTNYIDMTYEAVPVADGGTTVTGTLASENFAINRLETANTATVAYGYDVTDTSLTDFDGFEISPVPTDTIVFLSLVYHNGDPVVEPSYTEIDIVNYQWVFEAPNPIVGACP